MHAYLISECTSDSNHFPERNKGNGIVMEKNEEEKKTTTVRRKEGSHRNPSLMKWGKTSLFLGTFIALIQQFAEIALLVRHVSATTTASFITTDQLFRFGLSDLLGCGTHHRI